VKDPISGQNSEAKSVQVTPDSLMDFLTIVPIYQFVPFLNKDRNPYIFNIYTGIA
jgi:hypothetical protein